MLYGNVIFLKKTGEDGSKYPVTEKNIKIGRSENCPIRIQNIHVASEHCQLTICDNGQAKLKNLSNNPLYHGNSLVEEEVILCHGDLFKVGDRVARWEYLPKSKYYQQILSQSGRLVAVVMPQQRSDDDQAVPGTSSYGLVPKNTPVGKRKCGDKSTPGDSTKKISKSVNVLRNSKFRLGRHSLQCTKMLFSSRVRQRKSTSGIVGPRTAKTPPVHEKFKKSMSAWKVNSASSPIDRKSVPHKPTPIKKALLNDRLVRSVVKTGNKSSLHPIVESPVRDPKSSVRLSRSLSPPKKDKFSSLSKSAIFTSTPAVNSPQKRSKLTNSKKKLNSSKASPRRSVSLVLYQSDKTPSVLKRKMLKTISSPSDGSQMIRKTRASDIAKSNSENSESEDSVNILSSGEKVLTSKSTLVLRSPIVSTSAKKLFSPRKTPKKIDSIVENTPLRMNNTTILKNLTPVKNSSAKSPKGLKTPQLETSKNGSPSKSSPNILKSGASSPLSSPVLRSSPSVKTPQTTKKSPKVTQVTPIADSTPSPNRRKTLSGSKSCPSAKKSISVKTPSPKKLSSLHRRRTSYPQAKPPSESLSSVKRRSLSVPASRSRAAADKSPVSARKLIGSVRKSTVSLRSEVSTKRTPVSAKNTLASVKKSPAAVIRTSGSKYPVSAKESPGSGKKTPSHWRTTSGVAKKTPASGKKSLRKLKKTHSIKSTPGSAKENKKTPVKRGKRKLSPSISSAERAAKRLKTSIPRKLDKNKKAALLVLGKANRKLDVKITPNVKVMLKRKIVKKAIKQSTKAPIVKNMIKKAPVIKKKTGKKGRPPKNATPKKVLNPEASDFSPSPDIVDEQNLQYLNSGKDESIPKGKSSPEKGLLNSASLKSPLKQGKSPEVHGSILPPSKSTPLSLQQSDLCSLQTNRRSKRLSSKNESSRPEFMELSPTALGLMPKSMEVYKTSKEVKKRSSSATTPKNFKPTGITKSASTSKIRKRKSLRFSVRDSGNDSAYSVVDTSQETNFDFDAAQTPNVTADVFVSPLDNRNSRNSVVIQASETPKIVLQPSNLKTSKKSPKGSAQRRTCTRQLLQSPRFKNLSPEPRTSEVGNNVLKSPEQQNKNNTFDVAVSTDLVSVNLETDGAQTSSKDKNVSQNGKNLTDSSIKDITGDVIKTFESTPTKSKNVKQNVTKAKQLLVMKSINSIGKKKRGRPFTNKSALKEANIRGLRTIYSSARSPRNDLSNVSGVRELFSRHKPQTALSISPTSVAQLFDIPSPVPTSARKSGSRKHLQNEAGAEVIEEQALQNTRSRKSRKPEVAEQKDEAVRRETRSMRGKFVKNVQAATKVGKKYSRKKKEDSATYSDEKKKKSTRRKAEPKKTTPKTSQESNNRKTRTRGRSQAGNATKKLEDTKISSVVTRKRKAAFVEAETSPPKLRKRQGVSEGPATTKITPRKTKTKATVRKTKKTPQKEKISLEEKKNSKKVTRTRVQTKAKTTKSSPRKEKEKSAVQSESKEKVSPRRTRSFKTKVTASSKDKPYKVQKKSGKAKRAQKAAVARKNISPAAKKSLRRK